MLIYYLQIKMICARCQTNLDPNEALGGKYGGVVCINHRICPDCWWNNDIISINKGNRKYELSITKSIPLVKNPRQKMEIKCYGCYYKLNTYNSSKIIKLNGSGLKYDPIVLT